MSGLCWMAVLLALFLSTGHSLDIKDQNNLAKIVGFINNYNIQGQFSLAVNIPKTQEKDKLKEVFEKDSVLTSILKKGDVYKGTNVVAAKFKKFETFTEHAEARVLDNIQPLADKSKDNSLVFYSYLSPCGAKCTNLENRNNILRKINEVFPKWEHRVFVFSKVFDLTSDGTSIPEGEIIESLNQLKKSEVGDNIFRCYKVKGALTCTKCYSENNLLKLCYSNKA